MKPLLDKAFLYFGFRNSTHYWERRYRLGHGSGGGSYGDLAAFKADVLNAFVQECAIESVAEFGCGDGNQLSLSRYPRYVGYDVSRAAVEMCRDRYEGDRTKSFLWYDPAASVDNEAFAQADLTLSLDVIYHLVEDAIYERYLHDLFAASRRYVFIYSSNKTERAIMPHVRHREFIDDVELRYPEFSLTRVIDNKYPGRSFCSFFLFEREGVANGPPNPTPFNPRRLPHPQPIPGAPRRRPQARPRSK